MSELAVQPSGRIATRLPSGTILDPEDESRLGHLPWRLGAYGYVVRSGRRGEPNTIYLHLEICSAPPGMQVDHINLNPLDNRRSNLRPVSRSGNQQNRSRISGRGSSEYRGVFFDRERGKWVAQAKAGPKHTRIGRFDTEDEAAEAVRAWRRVHMPTSEADK